MATYVQRQELTRSHLSKAIPSIFTESSRLPETARERKVIVGWSDQVVIFQGISALERKWMVNHSSTVSVPQTDAQYLNQLDILQQWYVFRGERIEILRFLERYPFLVSLLVEAYYNIVEYFPHSLVFLTVISDPEEFGTDQLIASIATDQGPEEAADALGHFDKKWWLNSLKRAQGKLCITLESR